MRERFAVLSVKKAWENTDQRKEIIDAVQEFEQQLRNIAGSEGAAS
jgi:antibiotic biosynthesis monooxygenase (ABM) superfamily enzyme